MATIVFAASATTTLWDDNVSSGTGVGRVEFVDRPLANLDTSRPHPRGRGHSWKKGGRGSALLYVGLTKRYTAQTGEASFRAALDTIIDDDVLGTLTVTGRTAVANCRLVEAQPVGASRPMLMGGTTYHLQDWVLLFERMR